MQKRKLGVTDLELTTVGLGTWAIGGGDWKFGWGRQDAGEAVAAIHKALELGVNWIDTAAVYGDGESEVLVGKALQEMDQQSWPLVATKCGRIIEADGSVVGRLKADSVRGECEASLSRLGVETIDLYQMHWPDPEKDIEEAWTEMVRLKDEGKVRHIGVSNCNVAQLERLHALYPVASLQPPYNMINRDVEDDLLAWCADHGVGVVTYSPMAKGLLTGAVTRERAEAFAADDHRSRDPKFSPPQLDVHLELVEGLREIADAHRRPLAQVAIAWILRRCEVTSAIVGARRPSQIEGTAPAGDWVLTDAETARIDQILQRHTESLESLGDVDVGKV